jgi:hypothetical protein
MTSATTGKATTLFPAALLALISLAACGQTSIASGDSGLPGMAPAPQATTDTAPPAQDATGPICRVDADCGLVRDFCAATCGVCRALERSVARPTCLPPANVRCADACAGAVARCRTGQCVLE